MTDEQPAFTGCRPVLRTSDLAASLSYSRGQLGFTVDWSWPRKDPPTFAYVFRDGFELFLSAEDPVGSPMVIVVGLPSPETVDAIWAEYQEAGAQITEPPSAREWGTCEMRVPDPDGHVLRILN